MNLDDTVIEVLNRYPAPARPRQGPRYLEDSGGLSGARLWRYDSQLGPLLVRAWPEEFRDRIRLARIHAWLAYAIDLAFVPRPIACSDGTTFVDHRGRFWEVTPWLRGEADLSGPPDPTRVDAAFRGLAELHRRLTRCSAAGQGRSPGLGRRLQEIETLTDGGFDELERSVLGSPRDPSGERALRWLGLARAIAPSLIEPLRQDSRTFVRLQPCIRDARRDHFLFEGRLLAGIVDFGAMDVDCVSVDLARLTGDWLEPDASLRERAIAAYEAVSPLSPAERRVLPIFDRATTFLAPSHWLRWRFVERRAFDHPEAAESGLARALSRFERMFVRRPFDAFP